MTAFEFINEKNDIYNDKLDFQGVLNGAEKWLFDRRDIIPIDSYDVAFIHTSQKSNETTVKEKIVGVEVTTTQLGLAELRGACHVNYADGVINKAGIIYDDGTYSGVIIAAHELGHTLGAGHDRAECGGNDAGFIMSGLSRSPTSNHYKWSQCTVADFESFLLTSPQCLYNVSDQYKDLEPNSSDDQKVPDDVKPDSDEILDIRSILPADGNWKVIGNPFLVLKSGNHRSRFESRKNYKTVSNRAVYPRIMV